MLLPLDGRETIIQMIGHLMLLDLKVKHKIEEEGSPNLSFTYVLFLAGLDWILSTNILLRVNGRYMQLWLQMRNLLHRNDGTTVPNQGTVPNSTALSMLLELFLGSFSSWNGGYILPNEFCKIVLVAIMNSSLTCPISWREYVSLRTRYRSIYYARERQKTLIPTSSSGA